MALRSVSRMRDVIKWKISHYAFGRVCLFIRIHLNLNHKWSEFLSTFCGLSICLQAIWIQSFDKVSTSSIDSAVLFNYFERNSRVSFTGTEQVMPTQSDDDSDSVRDKIRTKWIFYVFMTFEMKIQWILLQITWKVSDILYWKMIIVFLCYKQGDWTCNSHVFVCWFLFQTFTSSTDNAHCKQLLTLWVLEIIWFLRKLWEHLHVPSEWDSRPSSISLYSL